MKKFILYFQGLDIYYVREGEFRSKLLKNNSKEIISKLLKFLNLLMNTIHIISLKKMILWIIIIIITKLNMIFKLNIL